MAAYRRVYDSRHLQADCHEPGSAPETSLGNRVWATFFTSVTVTGTASIRAEFMSQLGHEMGAGDASDD